MQVSIVNAEGKEVGTPLVLGPWAQRVVQPALLHQAVVTAHARARIPWAHTKGRGEVRGGGRKPWRQKGTGRSRHGSIRSPLWKGGGVTFGPSKERTYAKRLPYAMRRTALAMALCTKVRDRELHLVETIPAISKTKDGLAFLQKLGLTRSVLILLPPAFRGTTQRSVRNLPGVAVISPAQLTAADVLHARHLLATPESWRVLEQRLAR